MNIVISGASRGIGYELAKLISKDKDRFLYLLSRNEEKLKDLQALCVSISGHNNVNIIPIDLMEIGGYSQLVQKIDKPIDILINNAGSLINKSFETVSESEFDTVFSTNVKAPFFLTQYLLKKFSKNAHIVNISSMGGVQGSVKFPGLSAYSASKGALSILTEVLAEEFKDRGIKVNCLALGAVQTEMLDEAFPGYKAPLTALEMAEYIIQFALNGHKYFNGKVIPIALSTP